MRNDNRYSLAEYNTPFGALRCSVFGYPVEVAKFYTVKTKASVTPFMYVAPLILPIQRSEKVNATVTKPLPCTNVAIVSKNN